MARSDVESCSCSGGGKAAAEERIFVIEFKTIPLAAIGKKERRDVGGKRAGSQAQYRGRLREIPCAERPIGRCAWRVHPCTDGDHVFGRERCGVATREIPSFEFDNKPKKKSVMARCVCGDALANKIPYFTS